MLNVGRLNEGVVLDHIKAGKSMMIYHDLKLDKMDCCVAIIKNARSEKMGRKDIIKIECPIDSIDLDILGFIDHTITVNIVKDGSIVEKKENRENMIAITAEKEELQQELTDLSHHYDNLKTDNDTLNAKLVHEQEKEHITLVQKGVAVRKPRLQYLLQPALPGVNAAIGRQVHQCEGPRVEVRKIGIGGLKLKIRSRGKAAVQQMHEYVLCGLKGLVLPAGLHKQLLGEDALHQ